MPGVPVTTYNISYSNTNKKCFFDNRTISVDNETLGYTLQVQEHAEYLVRIEVLHQGRVIGDYQSVGRRSNVGTARVKSHVIRVQNASKLGEKA